MTRLMDRVVSAGLWRRQARARLRQEAARLRPGLWVASSDTLWRHWRTPVPEHLRLTKGAESAATPASMRRRLGRRLRWLAGRVASPAVFWNGWRGSGRMSLAATTHEQGVVLLAPDRGRVVRIQGTGPVEPAQVVLRRRFQRHVPSPSFHVEQDHDVIVEEYIDGAHLLAVSADVRRAAVRELLDSYACLVRDEGEGDAAATFAPVVAAARAAQLAPELAERLDLPTLQDRARTWPLVPSATDAKLKNLMVVDGHRPVAIDLGNLRLDVFFSYPVGVVAEARPDVLAAYLDGDLDREVAALFEAAGAVPPRTRFEREAVLAARIALTSHREVTRDGDAGDPAAYARVFARRWQALGSQRPPDHR